jgi:hypothetical protein
MSKRRAVWRASDIRDWDAPRAAAKTQVRTSSAAGAPAAPPGLDPDVTVQVKTGRQEWSTRLRWVMDLLDKRETNALQTALAKGRPLVLGSKTGRAAMTITAAVTATVKGTDAASSASDPSPTQS